MKTIHDNGAVRIVKTFTHATKSELYKELSSEQKEIILSLLERRGTFWDSHNEGEPRHCDAFAIWKYTSHRTGDTRIEVVPVYDNLPFCINPFTLEDEFSEGHPYAELSTCSCGGTVYHNDEYQVSRAEHWDVSAGFLPDTVEFHVIRPRFFSLNK